MKDAFIFFFQSLINLLKEIYKFIKKKFPLKEQFKIKHIFEIAAAYILVVVSLIVLCADIPYKFNKNVNTVAVYGTVDRIGEAMVYNRVLIGAKRNGWNVIGFAIPEVLANNQFTRHFCYAVLNLAYTIYKPKFNIHISPHTTLTPYGYNIMYLNLPNEMLFDQDGGFNKILENLEKYDAYIDVHSVTNGKNQFLKAALEKHHRYNIPIIPLYFMQNYIAYSPAKREQLLVTGTLWGCNRESVRIRTALQRLSNEDLLIAYGLKDELGALGKAYKGRVESIKGDKNDNDKLLEIQKKYGISLVLHTLEHMLNGIPTNRIAEAITAGAIVISDENGFIKKFFGNNILYINTLTQPDEIYNQIMLHVNWIKQNPAEVERKSKAAYDILMKDFCIEKQLLVLNDFVDKNKDQKVVI